MQEGPREQGGPGASETHPDEEVPSGVQLSQRPSLLEPFLAMEVMERARTLERAGRRIIHLELGEPDFPAPAPVLEACGRALAEGRTRYTDSRGLHELRVAIAGDCAARTGHAPDPDDILVCNGTSPAMLMVFSLLADPGDEVILGDPYYPCYPNFIRHCGARPRTVPTSAEEGFRLDPEAVRAAITERTRAIVVASPANPTGAIQDEVTLQALADLGVPLISDEIYGGLVYGEARVASALGRSDRVFVLDGFSKRYAMTGFRLGYVVAPSWARRPLQIMQQNLFISANEFVQAAGLAAIEAGQEQVHRMREAYALRRDLMVDGLRGLGLRIPRMPDGAFYVLADARHVDPDSRRLAFALLERAGVGTAPGIDFGPAAEGHLRFSYAASPEAIREAMDRLGEALPRIREERGGGAP